MEIKKKTIFKRFLGVLTHKNLHEDTYLTSRRIVTYSKEEIIRNAIDIMPTILSSQFFKKSLEIVYHTHLYYIHFARVKLAMTLLPNCRIIVDIGGANCPLNVLGYPHKFDSLTIVDLPPEERYADYKNKIIGDGSSSQIFTLFTSMTDLSYIKSNTVDMVWAGQSIEHIEENDLDTVLNEVKRVLKIGGYFCFDTPNRLITEIHAGSGNFINPDHRKEYYPDDIRKKIIDSGFLIEEEKGLCEMPSSYKTKQFDYKDFIVGNPISNNVEISYIQYYKCKKT